MRIASLVLENFRSYQGVAFNLDASRVLISGVNGSGKTSVRDGIAWALTGATPDLSGKGSGGELLAPADLFPPQARVTCALDTLSITRAWTNKDGQSLRVDTWTGNLTEQQTALEAHLNASPTLVHLLCDARSFLRLDHAEAKSVLLALLDVRVPVQMDPAKPAEPHTLEQLDAAYDMAVTDRKLVKRRLQSMHVPEQPIVDVVYKPVAEYEARLTQLRDELGGLERGIGETVGQRTALYTRLKRLDEQRPRLLDPAEVQRLEAAVESLQVRLEAFVDDTTVPGTPERLAFLTGRVQALAGHRPERGCVLDGDVPCKTPLKAFTTKAGAYEHELEAMPRNPVPSRRATLDATLRRDVERLEAQQQAVRRHAEIDADVAALETQIAALPDTSAHDAAIAAKKAHIAKGEAITAEARRHVAARDAWSKAVSERQTVEAEVERLERLCEALGPKGLRVEALRGAMDTFVRLVQPYLKPFGWKVHFQIEPWGVFVNNRPVQTYSASERYRIGVGLQLAIAQASGLSFAIVDELDLLDAEGNRKLGTLLFHSPVEQILILRTRDTDTPLPHLPGVLAYRLAVTDGRTAIVETVNGVTAAA